MKKNQAITIDILQKELRSVETRLETNLEIRLENKFESKLTESLERQEKKFEGYMAKQEKKFERHFDAVAGRIEKKQALMAEDITTIHEKIAVMNEMLNKNTEDIEIIKLNINLIRGDLKSKVDRDEFSALERRVFILERKASRT